RRRSSDHAPLPVGGRGRGLRPRRRASGRRHPGAPALRTLMQVGFVVYGSLQTATGGYLYDRQLVDFLRASGDTVDVVSLPDRGYVRNLASRGVPHPEFDVVVEDELCHPTLTGLNRRTACPVVAVVHLLRTDERRRSRMRALYAAVERRYLSGVDAAVFNSETTRQSAER